MKKSVPVKGTSPKVSKDPTMGFKYSTGQKGRATPCKGKKNKKRGNPPK